MGRLTTHVLDTARGRPAAGLRIELHRLDANRRSRLAESRTNEDGRTDAPLAEGDGFVAGVLELTFHAGEWLEDQGLPADFLGTIPVRVRIADARRNYHVPLLLSPYAYSTYRGS